jgi:hypothetical protein
MTTCCEKPEWPKEETMGSGIVRDFGVRWNKLFRYAFQPGALVNDGHVFRPRVENGFAYEAMNDGKLASREPLWPKVIGETVQSGSVTLRCVGHMGGTDPITGSTWTTDATTGVTIQAQYITDLVTVAFVLCTLPVGATFELYNNVTTQGGRVERRTFVVEVVEQ